MRLITGDSNLDCYFWIRLKNRTLDMVQGSPTSEPFPILQRVRFEFDVFWQRGRAAGLFFSMIGSAYTELIKLLLLLTHIDKSYFADLGVLVCTCNCLVGCCRLKLTLSRLKSTKSWLKVHLSRLKSTRQFQLHTKTPSSELLVPVLRKSSRRKVISCPRSRNKFLLDAVFTWC
jgi:hypothetical protein